MEIDVRIDATTLSVDTILTDIIIHCNDPDEPECSIPIYLNIYPETGVATKATATPKEFILFQNFPNPFNPVTHIRFELPTTTDVIIELFNIHGEKIQTLLDNNMTAGFHTIDFDGSSLASGVYIYKVKAGNFSTSKKMLLLK